MRVTRINQPKGIQAMSFLQSSTLLRQALIADATVSGVTGLLLFLGAGLLAGLLDLPEALSRYAGLALLPFAAAVFALARQANPSRAAVRLLIAVNLLWAVASVALLVGGWIAPNLLGTLFVAGQALVVALFAEIQFIALRRAGAALA